MSSERWFKNFQNDKGGKIFPKVDPMIDLNKIFRPRANDVRKLINIKGDINVWCTFSHDR